MTFKEYQEALERIPRGPWGPRGRVWLYRVTVAGRPPALRRTGHEDVRAFRERLERHARDAEHDRVVRRLRALR